MTTTTMPDGVKFHWEWVHVDEFTQGRRHLKYTLDDGRELLAIWMRLSKNRWLCQVIELATGALKAEMATYQTTGNVLEKQVREFMGAPSAS